MARLDSPLRPGDEVAFPLQSFDVGAELAALRRNKPQIGALVAFIGLVREVNDGVWVSEMTLEHYPARTEKALEVIVGEARRR